VNLLLLHGPLSPGQLGQLSGISSLAPSPSDRPTGACGYVRGPMHVDQRKVDRRKVFVVLDLDRLGVENVAPLPTLAAMSATTTMVSWLSSPSSSAEWQTPRRPRYRPRPTRINGQLRVIAGDAIAASVRPRRVDKANHRRHCQRTLS